MPNALMVSGLIFSLFRRLEVQGLLGIILWLTGILLPFLLCFILYRCKMIGASDSKLFSVIGSYFGVRILLNVMVLSLGIGAFMAILKMIQRRNIIGRFLHLSHYIFCWKQGEKWKQYYDKSVDGEDGIIPFTVAISLATLICAF